MPTSEPRNDQNERAMSQIEIDSVSIHYESTGEGQPVLFIHGLGSSTRDWERQVEHFSSSHRVVTVDLRGHGKSGKPKGTYSIGQFSEDVARLIERIDLAPVSVVGISLGGMVSFQLAADHPDIIDKLVVVNALPDNELLRTARGQILLRKLIVRFLGLKRMGKFLGARLFPDEDMREERAMMAERWAANDKRAYQQAFQAIVEWPGVTERLESFDRPTLMISSEQDYVSLDRKEPYLEALPLVEHVVIEDARHAVPIERADRFNRVLEEFLGD